MTAACMTLIYQRRCGETFLKEQLKPIGVARLKPARQPLFCLFFLSSPCQPSTKSWSTIPRGESLTERNISQLWWILFSKCFQVKTILLFLALRSIPLANVGGFSWLMSPLWFNPAHKRHVNVVPSNPKVSHKCQCFPWPETFSHCGKLLFLSQSLGKKYILSIDLLCCWNQTFTVSAPAVCKKNWV